MKPIVFDTVIDGKLYTFKCIKTPVLWYCWTYGYSLYVEAYGNNEEQAILKLVKLLEK